MMSAVLRGTVALTTLMGLAQVDSFVFGFIGTSGKLSLASSLPVAPVMPSERRRDFYEILGISPYTDAQGIKQAFRKLAKEYHPDSNKDSASQEKFYELYRAYSILKDPQLRLVYNIYGEDGLIKKKTGLAEEAEEEPPHAPFGHSNEANSFHKGLGQHQTVGGDFHVGGVFRPIQSQPFGDHINQRETSTCNFGNVFRP